MALPEKKIKQIKLPNDVDGSKTYEIVPEMLGKDGYSAELPVLTEDSTIALSTDIEQETARAEAAEAQLAEDIAAETARAGEAEESLGTRITLESADRVAADTAINARINDLDLGEVGSDGAYIKVISQSDGQVNALSKVFDNNVSNNDETNAPTTKAVKTYVDAETTRATTAEQALNTRIDDLDLGEVGAAGSYIKLVSQSDGQVSATAQAFDTDVLNNTETNAPTTKAVKTYVDTYGGKIDTITIDGVNLPITNKNVEIPTVRTDISNQDLSSTQKTNAKTNLNLENVDNTSDLNKPISTATQAALDLKADDNAVVHLTGTETISGTKIFKQVGTRFTNSSDVG